MNFLIYIRQKDLPQVLPENRRTLLKAQKALRWKNISETRQEILLSPLIQELNDPESDVCAAQKSFEKYLMEEKNNPASEWMDFFVIAFLYTGVYLAGFNCILEPLLFGRPMESFSLGFGTILQTIGFYLICKGVMAAIDLTRKKWQESLCLILLFGLYLLMVYLCRFVPGSVPVSPVLVLVVLGLLAWLSMDWHRKNLFSRPSENRIQ